MAQDGAAQVGQAGHLDGGPPEPHVSVPGSVVRRQEMVTDGGSDQTRVRWRRCQDDFHVDVFQVVRGFQILNWFF